MSNLVSFFLVNISSLLSCSFSPAANVRNYKEGDEKTNPSWYHALQEGGVISKIIQFLYFIEKIYWNKLELLKMHIAIGNILIYETHFSDDPQPVTDTKL